MIQFVEALPEDAPALAEVSKRAFDDDVHYGLEGDPGGPPGYDSPEWQAQIMGKARVYYKIVSDGAIVGGMIVFDMGKGHYYLGRIFIEPESQNLGIGAQAFDHLWSEFPAARLWTLETPAWNRRNHHFYSKVGFVKVREDADGYHYERRMAPHLSG